MNKEEIAKKIQAEKDSYNREINRLQQEILKVKERHQSTIAYLQNQKQQCSEDFDLNKSNEELKVLLSQLEFYIKMQENNKITQDLEDIIQKAQL